MVESYVRVSCSVQRCRDVKIETVEGIAKDGEKLHPLQQKFLEHAALQCGICTPGFLVAAKALLDKNPKPTEHEVRFAFGWESLPLYWL